MRNTPAIFHTNADKMSAQQTQHVSLHSDGFDVSSKEHALLISIKKICTIVIIYTLKRTIVLKISFGILFISRLAVFIELAILSDVMGLWQPYAWCFITHGALTGVFWQRNPYDLWKPSIQMNPMAACAPLLTPCAESPPGRESGICVIYIYQ